MCLHSSRKFATMDQRSNETVTGIITDPDPGNLGPP